MALLTRLAIAASAAALFSAPAFAQNNSTALNGQLNWGDVVANITVVTHADVEAATAAATSAGNAVSGANLSGGLRAQSDQTMSGASFATATLQGGNIRNAAAVATAQGN